MQQEPPKSEIKSHSGVKTGKRPIQEETKDDEDQSQISSTQLGAFLQNKEGGIFKTKLNPLAKLIMAHVLDKYPELPKNEPCKEDTNIKSSISSNEHILEEDLENKQTLEDDDDQVTVRRKSPTKQRHQDVEEEEEEEDNGLDLQLKVKQFEEDEEGDDDEDLNTLRSPKKSELWIEDMYSNVDYKQLVASATRNQVLNMVNVPIKVDYENLEQIKEYIQRQGFNFKEVDKITKLGQGGESYVLRLIVKQPLEVVAKMVILFQKKEEELTENIANILTESHLIRMLQNNQHVVEIYEEMIEYNQESHKIENYIVIVEQAQCDLSNICTFWREPQSSLQKQESFSEEKLFYFLLKATQAVEYIHSKNIYYGDMKEANLLIFRDYSVKIGDFGVSIKLKDEPTDGTDTYQLKGLTWQYAFPSFKAMCDNGEGIQRKMLLKNDYFAIFRTFDNIRQKFGGKIKSKSYFSLFLQDINDIALGKSNNSLSGLSSFYSKQIEDDPSFIYTLCDQIIKEEKFFAIPNILALSKHRTIPETIKSYFNSLEKEEFAFLRPTQKHELDVDQVLTKQSTLIKVKQSDVISELQEYTEQVKDFYGELGPLIERMLKYRLSLMNEFYSKFYRETFSRFYNFKQGDVIMSLFPFIEPFRILNKETVGLKEEQLQEIESIIEGFFKIKENEQAFRYYSQFYAATFTIQQDHNFTFFLKLIKLQSQYSKDLIQVKSLYHFLDNITSKEEYQNIFQLSKLSRSMLEDQTTLERFKVAILYLHLSISFNQDQLEEQLGSKKLVITKVEEIQKSKFFQVVQHQSILQKFNEILQMCNIIKDNSPLSQLKQEREIFTKIFGELGNKMSENAFLIFLELKKTYDRTQKEEDEKEGIAYLLKATSYSLKQQRASYLVFLCQEYLKAEQREQLEKALDDYKEIDEVLFAILSKYYGFTLEDENYQEERILKQLSNYNYYVHNCKVFNSNSIFKKAFVNYVKKDGNQYHTHKDFRFLYNYWQKEYDLDCIARELESMVFKEGTDLVINLKIGGSYVYDGKIKDRKLNGKGVIQFSDRRVLKGTFSENKCHKEMKYNFPDGTKFVEDYNLGERQGAYYYKSKEFTIRGQYIQNLESGTFIIEYKNGIKYEGAYQNDMKSGKGVLYHNSNVNYEGFFKNDMKEGKGILYDFDYDKKVPYPIYVGNFTKNNINGKGTFYNKADNKEFKGFTVKGIKHGSGISYFNNDLKEYEGQFEYGFREVKGITYHRNGMKEYEGDFKKNKKNGHATIFYNNGYTIYVGQVVNGHYVGQGVLKYPNGQKKYEGQFVKGNFHGQGAFFDQQGNEVYKGEFKNGFCHCAFYYANGNKLYEGQFKNGYYSGEGVFYKEDGSVSYVSNINEQNFALFTYPSGKIMYEGQFLDGVYHGCGVLYNEDSKIIYDGRFVEGKYEGKGILFDPPGIKLYQGNFLKGKRSGEGTQFLPNGLRLYSGTYHEDQIVSGKQYFPKRAIPQYDGQFKNGLWDGEGVLYSLDGVILYKGKFQAGNKYSITYYKSGKKKFEGCLENQKPQGFGILYYEQNGAKLYEGLFQKDPHGQGEKYYPNGKTMYKGEFVAGGYQGKGVLFYENGNIKFEGEFEKNQQAQNKPGVEYYENGNKRYEGSYEKGFWHGQGICYYEDGATKFTGEFKDGAQHKGQGVEYHENGKIKYDGQYEGKSWHGQGTLYFDNGQEQYQGQFNTGKFHGQGVLYCIEGTKIYEGAFKEGGQWQGKGIQKYENGVIKYQGDFVDSQMYGSGILFYESGVKHYEGLFKNNVQQGQGIRFDREGNKVFEGEFIDGLYEVNGILYDMEGVKQKLNLSCLKSHVPAIQAIRDKLGPLIIEDYQEPEGVEVREVITFENGTKYLGSMKIGTTTKEGKGVFVHADGDVYEGIWKDNKLHGKGRKIRDNLNYEFGTYNEDVLIGQVTVVQSSGEKYEGNYEDGKKNGQGTITYDDGAQYVGEWKDNKREGKGTLKLATGARYEGEFKDGTFDGKGKYYWIDGDYYEGSFKAGQIEGYGKRNHEDGSRYEGTYVNGQREGEGTYIWKSGQVYQGSWKNNVRHGPGVQKNTDGTRTEGTWNEGTYVEPPVVRTHKNHQHPANLKSYSQRVQSNRLYSSGWNCSECSKQMPPKSASHSCLPCEFDLCHNCSHLSRIQKVSHSSHPHYLEEANDDIRQYTSSRFKCDECKSSCTGISYSCMACKYDLCSDCERKKKL